MVETDSSDIQVMGEAPSRDRPISQKGMLFRSVLGVALEYFDFTIFATFAPFFAHQYFVQGEPGTETLSALAVFAVGFLMRPVGSVFMGGLADRHGRKAAMVLAISLTAAASLVIAFTPTFEQIGYLAPVILLIARLVQGFGHGGESTSAYTFVSEISPANRRGLYGSAYPAALILGVMSATLLGALLTTFMSETTMEAWGWRIPFLIGGVLGLVALIVRRDLEEPEAFKKVGGESASGPEGPQQSRDRYSWKAVWQQRRSLIRMFALVMTVTMGFYTWGVGATTYAISAKGAEASTAFWAGLIGQTAFLVALPLWGMFSDRFGRRINFMIAAGGLAILTFPLRGALGSELWQLAIPMAIGLVLVAAAHSVDAAFFGELFTTSVRGRAIALPLALGVALFGGTAPYLNQWTTARGTAWWFAVYTIVVCIVTFVAAATSKEVAGRDFVDDD